MSFEVSVNSLSLNECILTVGDTFTTPTERMFDAMLNATLGDDVYEEDETVAKLESVISQMAGKEASLFVASGTMSNQLAIRTHLKQPPYSVLCDHHSHVYIDEAGGCAIISQALVTPVKPSNGKYITAREVEENLILGTDIHSAPTRLICLENTIWGCIVPLEEMKAIYELAKKHGILVHLDGSRLWHASASTGISIADYCKYADSISLCFSKGLCAPFGSCLVGTKEFISKSRWFRKAIGGGLRQSGIMAAAALVALEDSLPKLQAVHEMTGEVSKYFTDSLGMKLTLPSDTNMIWLDLKREGITDEMVKSEAKSQGIGLMDERIVFHIYHTQNSVEKLKKVFEELLKKRNCSNSNSA